MTRRIAFSLILSVGIGLSWASIRWASNNPPDLSRFSAEEKRLIENACLHTRYSGPAAYEDCLRIQVSQLNRSSQTSAPDLTRLRSYQIHFKGANILCLIPSHPSRVVYLTT